MDECFEKIDTLLKKQKKSQAELISYLGMSHGTYSHWKSGRNRSYRHNIWKIARFFGVPMSFFGEEYSEASDNPHQKWSMTDVLTPDELSLICNLRTLGESKMHSICMFVNDMVQHEE